MSTGRRRRNMREAAAHRMLAAEYLEVARELEVAGHRDIAAVFRRRAAANAALAEACS